jgi:hypothetical protein
MDTGWMVLMFIGIVWSGMGPAIYRKIKDKKSTDT